MADSFIQTIDLGLMANIFSIFGPIMGLTDSTKDIDFNPPKIAFRQIAEKRGVVQAELISVWKSEPPQFSWERNRSPVSRHGMDIIESKINIKAIPVDLNYEVTFWTQDLEILQQVTERCLFWIHLDPNLDLTYDLGTSGNQFSLGMDLHFGKIRDDSQIVEQFEKGKYFAYTIDIKIDGWVFINVALKEILHIYAKVYDFTKTDGTVDEKSVLLTEWEEHA